MKAKKLTANEVVLKLCETYCVMKVDEGVLVSRGWREVSVDEIALIVKGNRVKKWTTGAFAYPPVLVMAKDISLVANKRKERTNERK